MKLDALVCIRVKVPFEFDVDKLKIETEVNDNGKEVLANKDETEKQASVISKQRADAGKHAEDEIVGKIAKALGEHGSIVHAEVEEVTER